MKELIITKKFNTAKELINYILKEKYKNNINSIKISRENYNLLLKDNLIIEWKENYPGAIYYHSSICGLPIMEVVNVF